MTRKTRFSDVCGAMDELKRLAAEEPQRLHTHAEEEALPLLEDALYMIGRMRKRVREYTAFREQVRTLLRQLDDLREVDESAAEEGAKAIRHWLEDGAQVDPAAVADLHEAAENVRSVASMQEQVLRKNKDIALQIHNAFETVRGERTWLLADEEKTSMMQRLRRRYQAWLPPDPAGTIMLEWLCRDRLTVQDDDAGQDQPLVLFEDGGSIPMSQLRWNEELRNFVPAGSAPGASGLSYRGRRSERHQEQQ